jgi:exopolyphosphatase/guanosine-5'-triphosphate,3'-diphosphate pyrophosphatase
METDPAFASQVRDAHAAYAADRGSDHADARDWGGVAGTRTGLKCLHAHYAYHLVGGADPVGTWLAEQVEPIHVEARAGLVAAIDQGTNSCRLLVLEPGKEGDPPVELARDMVITRLGRGVDATGNLEAAAIERTAAVLETYARRARALGADRLRVGATSAVRDAVNRDVFGAVVRERTGTEMELIDGEREAGLSFLGAASACDPSQGPFLLQDIGGGSTEFVFGHRAGRVEQAISTQMGSVRLTERIIRHDPPSAEELQELERQAQAVLDEAAATIAWDQARTFVAVAGTATTLQAIALGLQRYDPDAIHGSRLSLADAERVLADLAAMTGPERGAIGVMAPGRGDVIVAGAVILVATMRRTGFDDVVVSEFDILDGLALELLGIG